MLISAKRPEFSSPSSAVSSGSLAAIGLALPLGAALRVVADRTSVDEAPSDQDRPNPGLFLGTPIGCWRPACVVIGVAGAAPAEEEPP